MTPSPPSDDLPPDADLDPDEQALMAVLDDEATPEQRRRVAGDPGRRARLADLRRVTAALAEPVPPPSDHTLDRLRATALPTPDGEAEIGVGADGAGGRTVATEDSTITALGSREGARSAPQPGRRSWPAWPAVAAAFVLLMAVGVGLLVTDGGDERATATTSEQASGAGDRGGADAPAAAEGGTESGADRAATTDRARSFDTSVAEFADDAELRDLLEVVNPRTLTPPPTGGESDEQTGRAPGEGPAATSGRAEGDGLARCSAVLESADEAVEPAVAALPARVDGEDVLVLSNPVRAHGSEPATIRLSVLDPVSCVPRFAVQRDR